MLAWLARLSRRWHGTRPVRWLSLATGMALLGWHITDSADLDSAGPGWLAALSYDLPFRLRAGPSPHREETVLVEISRETYGGADRTTIPRDRHAAVLRALQHSGARLVFLDVAFARRDDRPGPPATEDEELAAALAGFATASGTRIVFMARSDATTTGHPVTPPDPRFAAAAPWGAAGVIDLPDGRVRLLLGMVGRQQRVATAAWVAAQILQWQVATNRKADEERWLNYYGRSGAVFGRRIRFEDVERGLPGLDDMVRDRLVFIGDTASSKERFGNPCGGEIAGVEVHATAVLNLRHQEWLTPAPGAAQLGVIVLWGIAVPLALGVRPTPACRGAIVLAALGLGALGAWTHSRLGLWWVWTIPAVGQTLVALVGASATGHWLADHARLLRARPRAFISYRSSDGAHLAQLIYQALVARGVPAFLAPGRIEVGEQIPAELLRRIAQAKVFVLVLTPDALAALGEPGSWVAREVTHALKLGKRFAVVRAGVAPLKPEELPGEFRSLATLHGLAFAPEPYFEAMMNELCTVLGTRADQGAA